MTQKIYSLITGIIFSLMAVVHLWRIVKGWEITINGSPIPLEASWVGIVIAATLGFYGLRFGLKARLIF